MFTLYTIYFILNLITKRIEGEPMKNFQNNSTQMIFELFPPVKKMFEVNADRKTLEKELTTTELCFWELANFTSEPQLEGFDLQKVYLHLDADHISIFLDVLHTFLSKDTYLNKKLPVQLIRDEDQLLNQTGFAKEISAYDKSYTLSKVNTYYKRGNLPEPELIIKERPYWKTSTVQKFISDKFK